MAVLPGGASTLSTRPPVCVPAPAALIFSFTAWHLSLLLALTQHTCTTLWMVGGAWPCWALSSCSHS
eukprot:12945732-Alexandrium_andersonii.AAC.1